MTDDLTPDELEAIRLPDIEEAPEVEPEPEPTAHSDEDQSDEVLAEQ